MTEPRLRASPLDPERTRELITAALGSAEAAAARDAAPSDSTRPARGSGRRTRAATSHAPNWTPGDPDAVRTLPDSVSAFAWLHDGHSHWLFCDTSQDAGGMGQAVIDFPRDRYVVDTLDTADTRWTMRESAEGGPLVIGVPLTGHAVALRIQRLGKPDPGERGRPGPRWRGPVVIGAAVLAAAAVTPGFRTMHVPDSIVPGSGVSRTARLSDYLLALQRTPGDTPVYVLDGREPGGTMLVLGGTHADEPAGYLAAVVLAERARSRRGRIIVVPRANASGFTHNFPQEGHPERLSVPTAHGRRTFTYGARATNPVHQWPDPQVYTHRGSGQTLSGTETRNLNRAYPGRPDGTLTERIAFAITTLIERERVDLAIDLHEASPEYPVVNTIVAHQRAVDLSALASVNLQAIGMTIGLETSPESLHGLSHREWGDATPALAVLMETTNPAQGRLRGATGASQVIDGRDRFYVLASARGRLAVPFPEGGWPLAVRVARHLAAVNELARVASELTPERAIVLDGVPGYQAVVERGVGAFLNEVTGATR